MRHNADIDSAYDFVHTPVMGAEVLSFLGDAACAEGGRTFVDCTLGEGGHSELLLGRLEDAAVIGFERDGEILELARRRLEQFGGRMRFVHDNFANLEAHLEGHRERLSGFLYDFGISSYHFEKSGRGFAFQKDEALDMRLDGSGKKDARYIINNFSEKDLTDIFLRYGEERWAKRIARVVCETRKSRPIERTGELAELVMRAIPRRFHVRNIHPATRVFQALRIAVNDELTAIEKSLWSAFGLLAPGGRIAAISFHSLEDRIVKNVFRRLSKGCRCGLAEGLCRCGREPQVDVLTKKPFRPTAEEAGANRRARSAKLRACEKRDARPPDPAGSDHGRTR